MESKKNNSTSFVKGLVLIWLLIFPFSLMASRDWGKITDIDDNYDNSGVINFLIFFIVGMIYVIIDKNCNKNKNE